MSIDELTVFDIKYNEGMERLNTLLSKEYSSNFIRSYVERYKIDKSKEKPIFQKGNNITDYNRNIKNEEKRKQIVNIYEIREHNKKVQQFMNKNYLKNEIEWFKIKKREEEEIKNKYNNYNRTKIENDLSMNRYDDNKEIIRVNNLKMKKFSNLANKVNIDKIMKIKKLNQNFNKEQKNKEPISYNIKDFNDGVFIPYSEYKQIEMNNNDTNKTNKININQIRNYNPNKSEKINLNFKKINNKNKNNIKNNPKQIINKSRSVINSQIINKKKNNNNINTLQDLPPFNKNRITISQGKEINDRKNAYQKKLDELNKIKGRKTPQENRSNKNEDKNIKEDKKVLNNIEYLNFKSKKYEDKAKNQEQLMRIRGNKNYGNEDNVKLANLMIDSISTKLKILNQINSQENV